MATAQKIVQRAKEQLIELTGLKPDTISGLTKDSEGWHVALELVEMRRVPDANDMLATYDVLLDEEGALIRYQRTRRYLRGQTSESEE
jgi:hypothetical protein